MPWGWPASYTAARSFCVCDLCRLLPHSFWTFCRLKIVRETGIEPLSLPEIKSGCIDGAIRPGSAGRECGQQPEHRAKPAHPCSAISACEPRCNTPHKNLPQVCLAKDQHPVQALAAHGADQAFR